MWSVNELIELLQQGGWITFLVVFCTGIILSLSSCTIIRIPVVMSYIAGEMVSKKRVFVLTLVFIFAMVLSYTCIGMLFGLASISLSKIVKWSRYFYYLLAGTALAAGVRMAEIIEVVGEKKKEGSCAFKIKGNKRSVLGIFLLGLGFAVFELPSCPCCGAVLFVLAMTTFTQADVFYPLLIFLTYALGQSLPLFILANFIPVVKQIHPRLAKMEKIVKIVGGNVLILLAAYFFLMG